MGKQTTYCRCRTTREKPTPPQPRNPIFRPLAARYGGPPKPAPEPPQHGPRVALPREAVALRVSTRADGSHPLHQCESHLWYCEELDGARCSYYGDELKLKLRMRRRCAECIEMKGQ